MIRRPFPGLVQEAAPFFAMDEEEFVATLVEHGWSEAAALSELNDRREYEKQFVKPETERPGEDPDDPWIKAVRRRSTRKPKEVTSDIFDPDKIGQESEEEPI